MERRRFIERQKGESNRQAEPRQAMPVADRQLARRNHGEEGGRQEQLRRRIPRGHAAFLRQVEEADDPRGQGEPSGKLDRAHQHVDADKRGHDSKKPSVEPRSDPYAEVHSFVPVLSSKAPSGFEPCSNERRNAGG